MKFPAFAYAQPTTVAEAVQLLASDEEARPLAGGQTLFPILALRMSMPSCLVDLNAIDGLRDISVTHGTVTVGAMVTHAQNLASAEHQTHLPLLSEAVRHVAHEAIRTRGTIGGSIAHADAAAEMPLVAVALDATMIIATKQGERRVAASDFFAGHYTTDIQTGELLTAIEFPVSDHRWAFEEVARRPGDFALVMAAAGLKLNNGLCESARIALGSVADRPLRAPQAEEYLVGKQVTTEVAAKAAQIATQDLKSHGDIHASAEYRRTVVGTMVKRALVRAATEESA
ncbi:MAG: xanthine dehydrogenase family protein subunit M [Gammaproteobacteria bacterium]